MDLDKLADSIDPKAIAEEFKKNLEAEMASILAGFENLSSEVQQNLVQTEYRRFIESGKFAYLAELKKRTGVEISPELIQYARDNYSGQQLDVFNSILKQD